uniref:Uncharacterized protein n=1 Tax=Rhizophora mucronata TaxID=61149 RepID=A0A2P2QHH8_RHIMU
MSQTMALISYDTVEKGAFC